MDIIGYAQKGLSIKQISKLLDISEKEVENILMTNDISGVAAKHYFAEAQDIFYQMNCAKYRSQKNYDRLQEIKTKGGYETIRDLQFVATGHPVSYNTLR